MSSFKWKIEEISAEEYKKRLFSTEKNSDNTKPKNAYEVATDIRKFEIDKYWQRTGYFWAFIASVYGAYFAVLINMYKIEKTDKIPTFEHGYLPLVVLSALALFFSFAWYLANDASKHWQKNWEAHMDLLEDDITGALYKTFTAEKSYSVSKINILASKVISVSSFILLMYESYNFIERYFRTTLGIKRIIFCLFIILVIFGLEIIKLNTRGNLAKSGEIKFVAKKYEDFQ